MGRNLIPFSTHAVTIDSPARQLDEDEFAQLSLLLGEAATHSAWLKLMEQLRREQGTPSREVLLNAFEAYWKIRGQALCKEHLEKIAAETAEVDFKDVTIDALFPEPKSKQKPADEKEKPAKKKLKLWDRDFRPVSDW